MESSHNRRSILDHRRPCVGDGTPSATSITGTLAPEVFLADLVDTDNDLILGGSGAASEATGDFSFCWVRVTLNSFSYGAGFSAGARSSSGPDPSADPLIVSALTIDYVSDDAGTFIEGVELRARARSPVPALPRRRSPGSSPPATSWDAQANFKLAADGTSPVVSQPEPSAAIVFAVGLMVVGRTIRRRR